MRRVYHNNNPRLAHYTDEEPTARVFCGLKAGFNQARWWVQVPDTALLPVCANCRRSAGARGLAIAPEPNGAAALRGSEIPDLMVTEIPGAIYRVQGATDTYTVLVPYEIDLPSLCTCMAAKTNPQLMCKHQSKVFLMRGAA